MTTLHIGAGCFAVTTADQGVGERYGLFRSSAGGTPTEPFCFYTGGPDGSPVFEPFAVLPLFKHASPAAASVLLDELLEYERSRSTGTPAEFPAPAGLSYMPYQKAGIEYALGRRNVLFGDEPGLGKTIEAIGLANSVDARRVLVVCPAAVRRQWVREASRWWLRADPGRTTQIVSIDHGRTGIDPASEFVITSYNLASSGSVSDELRRRKWDAVVFDEAHYLKSPDAGRTRGLLGSFDGTVPGIVEQADRVVALTGTPLPNRPRECYTIARALDWAAIGGLSEEAFTRKFNPTIVTQSGFRWERAEYLDELQARLRCRFMVRRHKADVLKDLPDKQYELAYVEPDGAIKKVLRAEAMLRIDADNLDTSDFKLMAHVATVRREMGIAKAPGVVSHVRMLFDGGVEKLVIFAYHKEVMKALREAFGARCVSIDGGTSPSAREDAKSRFVSDPNVQIFLGQIQAAGTGVDGLQKVCNNVLFAEASWTPGENEQCVDRLHRIGQHSAVLAQFLVAPNSLDERILGAAIKKCGVIHKALDADFHG